MPKIRMNGYVTFYEDDDFTAPWKARQAIVTQHGFGRNSEFWRHWVPMLAGDYRVIRRDLRGHGGSGEPGPSYAWSFDNLLRDLSDFCDALKLKDFHLLAESTGGMLGVGYAATRADRLRSLTLCATPKTIGSAGQKLFAFGRASWQSALEEMGSEGWARALLSRPGTFPSTDPAQIEWAIQQFGRARTASLVGYSKVISTTDVTALLPKVKLPVLILAPTRSAATSIDEQQDIASALPQSELVFIDGAGHEIYIDRAEKCVTALRNFLGGFG
jgi:pimeloyl-ACP methyl ester carboxylesterase